jgi:hypothetical protein
MSAQLTLTFSQARKKFLRVPRYYDTTRLPLDALAAAVRRAEMQDEAVLAAFRCHLILAPSRCHSIVTAAGPQMLLTSVRRSIANLTKAGALRKLEKTCPGPYGSPEHLWELVTSHAGALAA